MRDAASAGGEERARSPAANRAGSRRLVRWGDVALLGGLAAVVVAEGVTVDPDVPSRALALVASLALIAPLTIRRGHPLLACWMVACGFALVAATGVVDMDESSGCQLTMLVALVTMARHVDRLAVVAATVAGVSLLGSLSTGLFADGVPAPGDLMFGIAFSSAAAGLGRALRSGALRTLRRRVELDAAHSAQEAAEAAARSERRRLARELHDLCSHHLVVASLHAAIAAREAVRAPEAVAAPLAIARTAVERTAAALAELTGAAPARMPDGAAALEAALEQARTLGARVEAVDVVDRVPDAVALTAARIVQEALTNAAKHAAGAPVTVALALTPEALEVTVRNGAGSSRALGSSGLGLVGMRERVRLLGGELEAGADSAGRGADDAKRGAGDAERGAGDAGGWLVRAVLPLAPPPSRRWRPDRRMLGGCPAWVAGLCVALTAWGLAEALALDDGPHAGGRVAAALLAGVAPALLWRRPAALALLVLAALALRSWSATIAPTSSPLVLLDALAVYAVARNARGLRGAVAGVLVLTAALPVSFLLDAIPEPLPDLIFLPALVLGAGVVGLLLRLAANDASALDDELARTQRAAAAARDQAVASERRRLEAELIGLTHRSTGELETLVAEADRQQGAALAATLGRLERQIAATLADLGRLAAVLHGR